MIWKTWEWELNESCFINICWIFILIKQVWLQSKYESIRWNFLLLRGWILMAKFNQQKLNCKNMFIIWTAKEKTLYLCWISNAIWKPDHLCSDLLFTIRKLDMLVRNIHTKLHILNPLNLCSLLYFLSFTENWTEDPQILSQMIYQCATMTREQNVSFKLVLLLFEVAWHGTI